MRSRWTAVRDIDEFYIDKLRNTDFFFGNTSIETNSHYELVAY